MRTVLPSANAMVAEHSPLNDVPEVMPERQKLFYDALVFSFETIDRAYRILQGTLAEYTLAGQEGEAESRKQQLRRTDALITAWSLVDGLHRLSKLVSATPGLRHGPAFESIMRKLAQAEELRHEMQHLEECIPRIEVSATPLWGYLTWATVVDAGACKLATTALFPGRVHVGEYRLLNPVGKDIEAPADWISLWAADDELELSVQHRAVAQFADRFERGAREAWAHVGTHARRADEWIVVDAPL